MEENRNFWKPEENQNLKEWSEKAICYYWMHLKAHRRFKKKNAWFTIPVIIISTITGTANFASSNYGSFANSATLIIGAMNIITGIITTIYQFLKIAELTEGHKTAALSWLKFHEEIKLELSKNPLDRKPPLEYVKACSDHFVNLEQFSPIVPEDIVQEFKTLFRGKLKVKLEFPEILGKFQPVGVFSTLPLQTKILTDSSVTNDTDTPSTPSVLEEAVMEDLREDAKDLTSAMRQSSV